MKSFLRKPKTPSFKTGSTLIELLVGIGGILGRQTNLPNQPEVWKAGDDMKATASWHQMLNFPAHGSGSIDRRRGRHDPNGHDFGRHYIHADNHVSYSVQDPGQGNDEAAVYFGR